MSQTPVADAAAPPTGRPRLGGRRALVTGAAQGLGRAYAVALADAGAAVAVLDVNPAVSAVAEQLRARGSSAWSTVADLADPAAVLGAVDGAAEALGGLDIVVNNAAVCLATRPDSDSYDKGVADFDTTIGVNLRGSFLVGRAAIAHLRLGGGDLVNVTNDHIHTCGFPEVLDHADAPDCPWASRPRAPLGGAAFDVYDASKWGINGLTNVWARVLAPLGIRVNSFGMGATDTPMYRGFIGDRPPGPGMMTPEAVAGVLVDLLAEGPGGRNGDSVEVWVGHPCALPPPMRWAFTGTAP